ncbi:inositol monophosphatase [Streptomyces sp. ET3-23]|uniref:inositol monophosphatase family protein n=1 Tax=Streptomyces sp. ET3-23 TaxID=2885643 RepID=UPI001D12219C|nr:inositol monophosphatase family protein [Streptomyces sp. ET3-23]MCC2273950.1 inositol monophosphatase [Streptomyces sp. ET3-23]
MLLTADDAQDLPLPASRFAGEHRLAVSAAREAGALLRSHLRGEAPQQYAVRSKGSLGDVVTDLDTLAETAIVQRIRACFPHDRILAEEAGELAGEPAGAAANGRMWLVDPLDGTNNVAIGLAACVVGIALCAGDEPVVGVVHDPVTGRTWSALRGCGARGPHGPLRAASRASSPAGPLLGWTQGYGVARDDPRARSLRTGLERGSRRLLQLWAPLLTWSMLARGDIDGFVGYRAEAIDLPAGALLALEAGAEIRALDGGPFRAGVTGPDTDRSFVAGRPEEMPRLLDLVNRCHMNS